MQKPTPPVLSDFGLTEKDLSRLPDLKQKKVRGISTVAIFVISYTGSAIRYFQIEDPKGAIVLFILISFVLIPMLGFGSLVAGVIVEWAAGRILSAWNPRYRRAQEYKSACELYERKVKEYDAWLRKGQEDYWRSLSGIAFEQELGKLFGMMGYNVELTPTTGDGGVDLLVRRNGRLTVVQCKAHSKKIPISVARELSASMRDFKAQDAILACFEGATQPVYDYIKGKSIYVWTVPQIVELQRKHGHYPPPGTK